MMSRQCDSYTCKHKYGFVVTVGEKIYQEDVKYCKVCETYLKVDGYRCPCCKSNIRCKSHSKKWKIVP